MAKRVAFGGTATAFHGIRASQHVTTAISDLSLLFELPVLAAAARVLPRRRWERFCRLLGGGGSAAISRQMAMLHEGSESCSGAYDELARAVVAARREHFMEVLHARWRARGKPSEAPARLHGGDNLTAALAGGKGVVLWVGHFAFAPLATKSALAEAGFRAWHMSRPEHGFSKTRFGIAVLNPIRWRVEERYLAGRILIDRRNPAAAALRARRLLGTNALVSITAGDWEGARVLHPSYGRAALPLASGAPSLAYLSGAPLLPVMATRSAPGEPIDVVVEAPIPADRSRSREAWIAFATQVFVDRLSPYVEKHPDQWRDWSRLRFGSPPPAAP